MNWTSAPTIISEHPGAGNKPSVTYRYAGDTYVLVEYGRMEFDLTLNFFVLGVDERIRNRTLNGLIESSPGFRSILVHYDAARCPVGRLIDHLDEIYGSIPTEEGLVIPSRRIHLPIAFDDSETREAVARYSQLIRADAPNVEGGTNVDYTVQYNGLRDREELYEVVLNTELWTAFIGFFPGLPFMFPIDPMRYVSVPKYNPTRTWTPEGAVGLGGPCYSIYPVESPGGYQLLGRTLPVYDLQQRNTVFQNDPILARPSDRIVFHRVSEEELLKGFEAVHADRYSYEIEEATFDVGAYKLYLEEVKAAGDEWRRQREDAANRTAIP